MIIFYWKKWFFMKLLKNDHMNDFTKRTKWKKSNVTIISPFNNYINPLVMRPLTISEVVLEGSCHSKTWLYSWKKNNIQLNLKFFCTVWPLKHENLKKQVSKNVIKLFLAKKTDNFIDSKLNYRVFFWFSTEFKIFFFWFLKIEN